MSDWKRIRQKIREGALREMWGEGKWIAQRMKECRSGILLALTVGVLGTLLGLMGNLSSKYLIDGVIQHQPKLLMAMLALMIFSGLSKIALDSWSGIRLRHLSLVVQNRLLAQVYECIFQTRWQEMSRFRSGDLLSRLNTDVNTVSAHVLGWLPGLITSVVHALGSLVIMLYYDPAMAGIALLSAPVSLLLSRLLLVRMRDHNQSMRQVSSELMECTDESFQQIHAIKSLDLVAVFQGRLHKVQSKYIQEAEEYNRFSVKSGALLATMSLVVSVLCMSWGVFQLWNGSITYGTMTLFLQLARALSRDVSSVVHMAPAAISALTSAGRIMEVTQLPKEQCGNTKTIEKIRTQKDKGLTVTLQNVCFSYQEGELVLVDCSMDVRPGDYVAIMGQSGCGKTTLLRLVLGILQPDKGQAYIAAVDGSCEPVSAGTREFIAYVPQGNTVFSGSIADNLRTVAPHATQEQMETALRVACAWEFVKKIPGGLDGLVGEKGMGLSEGQAQRISIARAIIKQSPVILFDEATSALDSETGLTILRNIKAHAPHCTCFVVTHRTTVLEVCNRSFYMRGGRLMESVRDNE